MFDHLHDECEAEIERLTKLHESEELEFVRSVNADLLAALEEVLHACIEEPGQSVGAFQRLVNHIGSVAIPAIAKAKGIES